MRRKLRKPILLTYLVLGGLGMKVHEKKRLFGRTTFLAIASTHQKILAFRGKYSLSENTYMPVLSFPSKTLAVCMSVVQKEGIWRYCVLVAIEFGLHAKIPLYICL
jgi:hypothetical protein